MRFTILEHIKAETPLAELFNAYLSGLTTLDICCTPRESMHDCRAAFAAEARGEVPDLSIVGQAQRYYELTVLGNALSSLYGCIAKAHELLTEFYGDYGGNLLAYAQANRRRLLNEDGGGDDADWHHIGIGNPDAGEGWEVTETTDPARLAEYSLHAELARFFPDEDTQGDFIGTSAPVDFDRYTLAVKHQTNFALRKMFKAQGGAELVMYQQDETGQYVPVPIIDEIEQELNEDIANERLAAHFDNVLNAGQHLAQLHATMPPDDLHGYALLYENLGNMLAMKMEVWPPF